MECPPSRSAGCARAGCGFLVFLLAALFLWAAYRGNAATSATTGPSEAVKREMATRAAVATLVAEPPPTATPGVIPLRVPTPTTAVVVKVLPARP